MSQQAFSDALSGDGGMADAPPPLPDAPPPLPDTPFFGDALAEDFQAAAPQFLVQREAAAVSRPESQGAGNRAARGGVREAGDGSSVSSAPNPGSRANAAAVPAEIVPVSTQHAARSRASAPPARPSAPVPQAAARTVPRAVHPQPFAPVAGAQPPFGAGYPGPHQQQVPHPPFFGANAAPQFASLSGTPAPVRQAPGRPAPGRPVPGRPVPGQVPRSGARGQPGARPAGQKQSGSSAGCFTYLVIAIIVLVFTGVGGKILDAIGEVLDW